MNVEQAYLSKSALIRPHKTLKFRFTHNHTTQPLRKTPHCPEPSEIPQIYVSCHRRHVSRRSIWPPCLKKVQHDHMSSKIGKEFLSLHASLTNKRQIKTVSKVQNKTNSRHLQRLRRFSANTQSIYRQSRQCTYLMF